MWQGKKEKQRNGKDKKSVSKTTRNLKGLKDKEKKKIQLSETRSQVLTQKVDERMIENG